MKLTSLDALLSYFPRQLPRGMTEFKAWSERIIRLTGPLADEDSMRFALCSQIMHLSPQSSTKADQYFIRSLRKAAANQVSSQVFQDIKTKQMEAAKEAQALADKAKQEASEVTTATEAVVGNVIQ